MLVVFVDHAECRWLRVLRAGFRHCFVVIRDRSVWLACDPLKDRIELSVLSLPENFDLPGFYAGRGHRVLGGATRPELVTIAVPTPAIPPAMAARIRRGFMSRYGK